ncbi:unnamed protein product [Mytilus coruscus]|uniref:SWIM-type domain-containing protein n=1 Tax=Mytilus coruscus TaxID=42192 RepID=A0A6J8EZ03_MYTCO|nr:unnamed protein product [Mytilus coruscus]
MDVYRDNITNSDIPGVQQGVLNARNVKQMENIVRKTRPIPKDEICIPKRVIKPDDIVKHVMSEIDSVREECVKEYTESTSTTVPLNQDSNSVPLSEDSNCVPLIEDIESNELQGVICEKIPKVVSITDKNLSQKSLARLTVENDNVTFVQQQKAFMVKGTQGNIYAVTLLPKETCQCPSTTQCYHILAAKMFLGDETDNKPRVVNLRLLSKRNLKRNDKKSGRKKPCANDYDNTEVLPAPDSEIVENIECQKNQENNRLQLETPKSEKKNIFKCKEQDMNTCDTPKQGKKLRFSEDEYEIQLISPSVSPKSTCRLPMKKRKLTTDAKSTNHTPWVASLNTEHKLMFSPLFDEDKQCWTENFGTFTSQATPCVQIHHTGKSHWITSLQTKKDSAVYLLDSNSKDFRLTPSTEIQLSAIYSHGKKNLLVKLPDVQQQTNGYDCGVYAIANVVEYCHKEKLNTQRRTKFIEKYMRLHLISCLNPQNTTSSTDFVRIFARRIECSCQCGKPYVFENMIGCEAKRGQISCTKWVHQTCSGVSEDWYCDEHRDA